VVHIAVAYPVGIMLDVTPPTQA